jgi:SAM-dependent methyltransferase
MRKFASRVINKLLRILGIELPVRFGSLRRVTPISRSFGLDRGEPIDRHYIEGFVWKHRHDIRGRVLEAGGLVNYAQQFGEGRVVHADVLYPKAGFPDGTVIGNLETGEGIATDAFDCLILTQVFPCIFDVHAAIRNAHRALRPGGVLLATLSGISQISRYDMNHWGDYWRFTDASARRLFGEVFLSENITVETHGNVLAACAFLHGLGSRELTRAELDAIDPDYQLSIGVRGVKAAATGK